ERLRAYLVSPGSKVATDKGPASPSDRPQPVPMPKLPMPAPRPSAAEQITLAVTGEINHLRSSLTEPLQRDIEALRQQQQALIQEIKQLEAKRQQQQSLAQQQANQQQIISEFLQVLTTRLEETLDRDLSQMLGGVENQLLQSSAAPYSLGAGQSEQSAIDVTRREQTSAEHPRMTPAQRLEQMQSFQSRADNLLMMLDSTVSIVFDTLQTNLETHQASLSQGIENMYGLSQQSEAMFVAFVNHLAEQLGREASSYVPGPIAITNLESAATTLSNTSIDQSAAPQSRTGELGAEDRLPYAGTEISSQFGQLRRDRLETPISLPDLADNLFGSAPERPGEETRFSEVTSEDMQAETGENVEDLYASLFAGEAVAELELEIEDFALENIENTAEIEPIKAQNLAVDETTEPLNTAEDLFVNLLDEGESLEDILVGEDSDFIIGNFVDDLTLDTEDLFEPQVATVPEVSEPHSPSIADRQIDIDADDRPNLEITQNRGENFDPPIVDRPAASVPAEINQNPGGVTARGPSASDVHTGEFDTASQRLDDSYIQASPDEDLLPVQALEDDLDRALNLDNNTLELLETDLYNLEGLPTTSSGRSNSSVTVPASSPNGTQNLFVEPAEEELDTLEDLFSDVLELSSDDEPFVLEDELEDDLFASEDESKLTLDDILASLTETDSATAKTDEVRSSPPESKKKT
ncbi:MAG: hypothetical protein ACMG55_10900, partial [Microcoleus sp.]